jgi:membrane-associated phospholipid phosphatase
VAAAGRMFYFCCMHLLSLWQQLQQWDQWLFTSVNTGHANAFSDAVLPWLRDSFYWAPLYIFILVFVPLNYGNKGWWWLLLFLCTLALTDMTGTKIFKEGFERLRPCNNPELLHRMRLLLKDCPSGYSFTSNHAANHFGMAGFIFFTFRHIAKKAGWLALGWAAVISYAQIYVGVHYPLDILGGMLLGLTVGYCSSHLFQYRFGRIN